MNAASFPASAGPVLVTGGAGFIGTNLSDRLLRAGRPVVVLDDLSRAGARDNLAWLRGQHGSSLTFLEGDVRNQSLVRRAVDGCDAVVHLAAQVAVTTSLIDPMTDFDVNARGTLTVLEALRGKGAPTPLLYTSTNKVYGPLDHVAVRCVGDRWAPEDLRLRRVGFDETQPLDFHSPYGCSKGAADQYVLDFARVYELPAVVFRMSCIYGPHQCGNADQGWVDHFARSALEGRPIVIFGDGKQVRDALFVEDLVDAIEAAWSNFEAVRGRAFNIGGGAESTLTPLELLEQLESAEGLRVSVSFAPWRMADQRYYVSDVRAFRAATGWSPRTGVREGLRRLCVSSRGAEQAAGAAAAVAPQRGRVRIGS